MQEISMKTSKFFEERLLGFKTQLKIDFLLPVTDSRKVPGVIPDYMIYIS